MGVFADYSLSAQLSVGVWTDITADVVGRIFFSGGIPRNGPVDFLAMTGTLRFTVKNASGQYSPNGGSALSGWKKGTKIKLEFTYDGQPYTRFYGAISDFDFDASGPRTRGKVTVTVVDWLDRAAKFPMNYPAIQLEQRADQIVQTIIRAMPTAPLATSLAAGVNTFPVVFDTVTDFTYALTEFNKICLSELCYLYLRRDRTYGETLVLENANTRVNAMVKTIPLISTSCGFLLLENGDHLLLETGDKLLLDEAESFTAYDDALSYETSYGDNVINDIRFRYVPRRYMAYSSNLDICWSTSISPGGGSSSPYDFVLEDSIEAGETKVITMPWGYSNRTGDAVAPQTYFKNVGGGSKCLISQPFPTAFLQKSMFSDNNASTPVADVTINSLVCYMDRFTASLTNSTGAKGYLLMYLTLMSGSARIIVDPDTQAPAIQDATSIAENDYQPLQFDQVYQIAATAGTTFANNVLTAEKNPRTVLNRINYNANRSAHYMMAFLNLDIGDMFPARDTNKGIDANFFIQDFKFTIDPGGLINYSLGVRENTYPVSIGSVVTGTANAGTTVTLSHTVAAGLVLLVVEVTLRSSESILSVVRDHPTGGSSQAFTLKSSKSFGGGDPRVELWYLLAPAVGSANIVITASGASFLQAASIDFYNVDQSAPFGMVVSDSGTGGTPSVSPAGAVGDMMLDVIGVGTGTITPDSSQTSRWNVSSDGSWRGGGSTEAGAASVPMSWTLGGANKWALLAVAIKKA